MQTPQSERQRRVLNKYVGTSKPWECLQRSGLRFIYANHSYELGREGLCVRLNIVPAVEKVKAAVTPVKRKDPKLNTTVCAAQV
jgi:hypothetical protein